MIKSKYIPYLAAIAMVFVIAIVAVGVKITPMNEKQEAITQPEYMSKIFDKDKVLEINIQIDENKWEELKENASAEEYYPADITINDETYKNVGIRAKGNSSLSMVVSDENTDRYSFKIKVNEYQEQNIYGLEKFVLNNMIGDATYMKEYISYDMYREMGIATPGYAFANITINGQPWGVYLAVESLEESFVERNFGSLNGNLYKVETSGGMGGGPGGKPDGMPGDRPQRPNGEKLQEEAEDRPEPPNGEMPKGEAGDRPEPPNGEKLQGEAGDRPEPPNEEKLQGEAGNRPAEMPSGEKPQNGEGNISLKQTNGDKNQESQVDEAQQINQVDNKNEMRGPGGMGGPGGGGSSGGANLVYKDDEISSYSNIFDYTILKKTTQKDYAKVIESIKSLNEGIDIEEHIDVEEVLKYFAINTFLVNLDSYAGNMKHNFYLYEEDGKLQILPWDYNLAFGAFMMSDASKTINFPIDAPVTDTMENSPLIAKLLEVEEYKLMYHNYLQELIDTYITSGKYEETITKLDTLISEYVKEDATAFYTYDEYTAAIKELKKYGIDRSKSIVAQLSGEEPSDEYGNIETSINLMAMGQQMGGKGGPGGGREKGDNEKALNGKEDGRGPQGPDMMLDVDMQTMQQVMEIIGEATSIDALTDDQKKQIEALDIDDKILESLLDMKKNFDKMGPIMGRGKVDTTMSKEDKIMAVAISILLIFGLVFALKFKRKHY